MMKTFILTAKAVIRAENSMEAGEIGSARMREVNKKMFLSKWHFYEYIVEESK